MLLMLLLRLQRLLLLLLQRLLLLELPVWVRLMRLLL